MNPHSKTVWASAQHMADSFLSRLPSLMVAVIVFLLFYFASILLGRIIRRATRGNRRNLGVVFARLSAAAVVLLGLLIAFSIVAPSFQAGDLVKVLGIGSVAIGFAFQNILQNFLAGLLLLWAEPFRVGDQIKLDTFEGTVEDIQTRATTIKTYDGRRVVIPNAELFIHSVTVNTAFEIRRWEYELSTKAPYGLAKLKSFLVDTLAKVDGVLPEPAPEALVIDLGDADAGVVKLRLTWWTKNPRQHEMVASHDRVLTAIREALQPRVDKPSPNLEARAA
jgi:small conductance mechanosensitive channel